MRLMGGLAATGEPLPLAHPGLNRWPLRIRRGQMSLTVAAPGVGKSSIWLAMAECLDVPAVYWSADTDQHDVQLRLLALHTRLTTDEIEQRMADASFAAYASSIASGSRIEWVFDPLVTPRGVKERLAAFCELHGEPPQLFVIDNLANVALSGEDERMGQNEVMARMQQLARKSHAHVAILAHAKGWYENGDRPIPQGGSLNNLFKLPEVGLTVHRMDENYLGLNVVKQRGGRSDATASTPIPLMVDYAAMQIEGFTPSDKLVRAA